MSNKIALYTKQEEAAITNVKEQLESAFKANKSWSSYTYTEWYLTSQATWDDPAEYDDQEVDVDLDLDIERVEIEYQGGTPVFNVSLKFDEGGWAGAYADEKPSSEDKDEMRSKHIQKNILPIIKRALPNLKMTGLDQDSYNSTIHIFASFRGEAYSLRPYPPLESAKFDLNEDNASLASNMSYILAAAFDGATNDWGRLGSYVKNEYSPEKLELVDVYINAKTPVFEVEAKQQRGKIFRRYTGVLDFEEDKHNIGKAGNGGEVWAKKSGGSLDKPTYPSKLQAEWERLGVKKKIIPLIIRAFPQLRLKGYKVDGLRIIFTLEGETAFGDVPSARRRTHLAETKSAHDVAWKVASFD